MNKIKGIFILLIFGFVATRLSAQTDCSNALYEGNKLFEAGQIKACIDRLEPCIPSIKNKEELIQSYHLLAQAYQNQNDIKKANHYIRKMLQLKPDYMQFPNIDPLDFSRLVNQFQVSPKLFVGLKFGFNVNSIALKKSYSVYASPQRYNPVTGYQFGITCDYRINHGLSINPELYLCALSINHVIDSAGVERQNYTEVQNYAMLHVSLQKHFTFGKHIVAYAGIGFGAGYLVSSNVNMEITTLETKTMRQVSKNAIEERTKFQPSLIGVIGIGTPLSKGILSLDLNYSYFFSTTVNASKRLSDLNFIFDNQYVNDDISLRLTMVNISYKLPVLWRIHRSKKSQSNEQTN